VAHFFKTAVACLRGFVCDVAFLCPQNEEMVTEGELRSNLDDSEKVRELQDKVADLKAEVYKACFFFFLSAVLQNMPKCFILPHTFLLVIWHTVCSSTVHI